MTAKPSKKLRNAGALVHLAGEVGVLVTFQYRPRLSAGSRAKRREELLQRFRDELDPFMERWGGALDPDTLNISAQTEMGVVPQECLDKVQRELPRDRFRMDILMDRQIIQAESA